MPPLETALLIAFAPLKSVLEEILTPLEPGFNDKVPVPKAALFPKIKEPLFKVVPPVCV